MANLDTSKPVYVSIMNGVTATTTYTFEPQTCNGNDMNYLKYINKWGAWDYLYFTGKRTDEFSTEYKTYKYQDTSNFTYDTNKGEVHKRMTFGTSKVILESGWVGENYNDRYKDLLLSEVVLLNGNDPVIITDKQMRFKTVRFDKMINYTITLDKAYNEINNII